MLARRPDPLDVIVGAKIRIFRNSRGLSQTELAERIGVAFQQVQKYEKGTNRVGAGRLSRIAGILGISVSELFGSSADVDTYSTSPLRLLEQPGALRILKAFSQTSDPRVRRAITQLVESVVDRQPAVKPSIALVAPAKPGEPRRKNSKKRA
jgi:transcriptional regulator with XRE-family HTH domain